MTIKHNNFYKVSI